MKVVKVLIGILFVGTMFSSCEEDNINEDIGIEEQIEILGEDAEEEVKP